MTGRQDPTSWAADVAREVRRFYDDGRAAVLGSGIELLDVTVRDERFWVATRNPGYAGPVGLVRRVEAMSSGFEPALDAASAAEILVGEVATPPAREQITTLEGVGWWGELPGAGEGNP